MLTGHSEKKRVMGARDAGLTEFLCKPISAKALYERILSVVANPAPSSRAKPISAPTAAAASVRTIRPQWQPMRITK